MSEKYNANDDQSYFITMNPVKAGLMKELQFWYYSSACDQNPMIDFLSKPRGNGAY